MEKNIVEITVNGETIRASKEWSDALGRWIFTPVS
jgi:hypothetical protein